MVKKDIETLITKLTASSFGPEKYLGEQIETAYRRRNVQQIALAAIPLAFRTNAGRPKTGLHEGYNFREMTQQDIQPYQDALNEYTTILWNLLEKAYKFNHISKMPGKIPVSSYDPDKACDARCWGAKGMDCQCKCNGAFHSMGVEAVRLVLQGS